jgi:hypothetical protein
MKTFHTKLLMTCGYKMFKLYLAKANMPKF